MRLLILLSFLVNAAFAAVPPELESALRTFLADAPKGWSFTQTSSDGKRTRIEHYDASQPEFTRWKLLSDDGKITSDSDQRDYREKLSRRSSNDTAPRLTDQLDLATLRPVADDGVRATYCCHLKPGEHGDTSAEFLVATLVLHRPSKTIESLDLAATGEFSPAFVVKIAEMRTTMAYSLPTADAPSLLQKVTTHLRGRAFLLKSLDADMVVAYTDYQPPARH